MTEEIIIDGVNVAGCNAYKEGHCLDKTAILLCDTNKCSNYNDCYYKQLQRLKQENKELKEKIIELSEEKGHLIVENNTLKEANQSLSMLGTDLASANETVRKEFFRADKNKDMWREKAEEYRSALEEIQKAIKSYDLAVDNGASVDTLYTIRKIINEVLK